MSETIQKLRPGPACRVVRLERDRYNEATAAGVIPCIPQTTPGRARLFDPFDLLVLWYYRELTEDGYARDKAGQIACAIAACARQNPSASVISYVQDYFYPFSGECFPAERVPAPGEWQGPVFQDTNIRKVTSFNVKHASDAIAAYTLAELSRKKAKR